MFPLDPDLPSTPIETSTDALIWEAVSPVSDIPGMTGMPLEVHLPLGKNVNYVRVKMNSTVNKLCRILVWAVGT